MRRKAITSAALLLCMLAAWSCGAQQNQSQHDFLAVLIDAASKKPVPSARIILAPKKEGKLECTIDTSLTAVSNDRGEVKIPNVAPGEYVVFQNPSGTIKPELNGEVVTWGRGYGPGYHLSLGPLLVKKGTLTNTPDGILGVANGYMETGDGDLGINTTAEGAFLTVRVPSAGSAPVKIEITDLSPSSPPRGAQQEQPRHDFLAVLIDTASKEPVPSARIILAPKKEGKLECTIDTSLTAVSNERGEVRIPNMEPGEYVVFYNLSASLNPELNGKVVDYNRDRNDEYATAISKSLGPLLVLKGSQVGFADGLFFINSGHMYAARFDLAMISVEGKLLTVRVPAAGSAPVRIEIITDLAPPSPPHATPKSGR